MKKKYFAGYTVMFALIAAAVFSPFWMEKITLIHTDDGWTQHYRALVYYAQWLRSIVRTLFLEHRLIIPQWSHSIGYGADVITTLSYYVMGDPLNLLSVAVPTRYMAYFYSFLVVLRLYLAGLAFSGYCFYMGKKKNLAVLTGALCYVFCGYALFGAIRHPFFLNPMIYFPLILTGVEKIREKKSPVQLALSVGLAAFSNFYFFYMLVVFTVMYVLIRVTACYKKSEIREAAQFVGKVALISFTGVLISAALLVPTLNAFMADQRNGAASIFEPLYDSTYYRNFLTAFLTHIHLGKWSYGGYSVVSLAAAILLFLRKGNRQLKAAFTACIAAMLIPEAGYLLNGASYVSNRWIWACSFVVALILVTMWEELFSLKKREMILLPGLMAVYFVAAVALNQKYIKNMAVNAALAAILLAIAIIKSRQNDRAKESIGTEANAQGICADQNTLKKQNTWHMRTAVCVAVVGMIALSYLGYARNEGNFVKRFKNTDEVAALLPGRTDSMMKNVTSEEDAFVRFTGPDITWNSTLYSKLHNTQFYWSISNPSVSSLMQKMIVNEPILWMYKGLDDRTTLDELASVGYYICSGDDQSRVPYGYEEVWSGGDNYRIYKNKYTLPLGYTYASATSEEAVEDMDVLHQQELMLHTVVLEKGTNQVEEQPQESAITDVPYEITCKDGVTLEGQTFTVTEKKAKVLLTFEGTANSETYLQVENLNYEGSSDRANIKIKCEDEDKNTSSKTLNYYTNRYKRYAGKKDFLMNLNYKEKKTTKMVLTFQETGTYTFGDIRILCQSMDNYPEQVSALKENVLKDEKITDNGIEGTITVDQNKILCLSVPYSSGWSAWVDGQKTEISRANLMYMALELEKGTHEIILRYQTPYLRLGVFISCMGIMLLIAETALYRRRQKRLTKK